MTATNRDFVIDESVPDWEPVDEYIYWLSRKAAREEWEFDEAFNFVTENCIKANSKNITDDVLVKDYLAVELAVLMRNILIAMTGAPITFHTENPGNVILIELLLQCFKFQATHNPFPLRAAEGLFTIITEAVQKSPTMKERPYMEYSKMLFIGMISMAIVKYAEIQQTRQN